MLECLHSDLVQQKQSTCYERPPHSKSERKVGLRLFAFYFEFIVKVVLSKRDAHSQKKGCPEKVLWMSCGLWLHIRKISTPANLVHQRLERVLKFAICPVTDLTRS